MKIYYHATLLHLVADYYYRKATIYICMVQIWMLMMISKSKERLVKFSHQVGE